MREFPKQKVSYQEKMQKRADGRTWWMDCIDYYADQVLDGNVGSKQELLMLLKACEGLIDESGYSYVLNPYSVKGKKELLKFPSRLRNYDILSIIFETALGEKSNEPDTTQVVCMNKQVESGMIDVHNKEMDGLLEQDFINNLNKLGMDTKMGQEKIEDYKKKDKLFYATLSEKKAIDGQEKIETIKAENRLRSKHQQMFDAFLKVNQCFSYKDVDGENIIYDEVPVHEIYPFMAKGSNLLEDGYAAIRLRRLTIPEIVDLYYRDLAAITTDKYDPIKLMEDSLKGGFGTGSVNPNWIESSVNLGEKIAKFNWNEHSGDRFNVYHGTWKSLRCYYEVTFNNPITGKVDKKCVDETYVLNKEAGDISMEKYWIDQVWEGTRIDLSQGHHIHLRGRPVAIQRNEIDNKSICKLPYNGLVKLTNDGRTYSWGTRGIQWQVLINILRYQLEKEVNKNKGKLLLIPKGLIPSEEGWDEDKFMYYGDALGYLFIDETNPNFAAAIQALKDVDMSLASHIIQLHELIERLKQEFYSSIGFNPQRMGEVTQSAGKGTTQEAIVRSFTTSRELFRLFDEFIESELNGLIDYSKVAWIDGKRGAFVNPTGKIYEVDIDGMEHAATEYGIFVRDTSTEAESLNILKQWGFSMAQNDRDPEMLAEVAEAKNVASLKAAFRKYTAILREYEMAKQKQITDSNERINQATLAATKEEGDRTERIADKKNITAVKVAAIKAEGMENTDFTPEELVDINAITDATMNNISSFTDSSNKLMQENNKMIIHNDKMNDKEKDRQSKEKVAKENKSQ